MFLTEADDGSMVLSVKAMAIYEATAQEFLKRLLVLKHIQPGPPLPSICKEKFSAKDRANFDLKDNGVEDMEDELDLIAMAKQSNHTYRTFNQAYAGSSTLTMNTLLHQNYQAQVRRRGAYSRADLEAVACRLYNTPQMKLRVPGQQDGLLAMMGPHLAEQVLLVMGTGSGKSLLFMVGASVADAQTTILVLPIVALCGDMLDRCRYVGIQPLIWSIKSRDSASLVIMSAEAVCTESFLEYAHLLVNRQQLDRIVIDECHLTITANDYCKCMSQLRWYVWQVKTQTVWLTATLPPTMQDDFIKHNKLIFNHAQDKIIIYCQSRDDVSKLREILRCPTYTSKSRTKEEKAEILLEWLSRPEQPVIVATSALRIRFDYPFVRWVVHVDAPQKMSDFSQESGRAGPDGRHREARPADVQYQLRKVEQIKFTRPSEVLRQDQVQDEVIEGGEGSTTVGASAASGLSGSGPRRRR
ncbi:hypothetical protein V501_00670 [Pseudogymnoascus sp. VKM F-4519 (FW-2642)]|nr:hypothetical protein V501_00670 [Pseudogymnoascus sp. VKM F-4519 (FW-2642)]